MNVAAAFCLPTVDDLDDGWVLPPVRAALQAPAAGAPTRRAASALLRAHYELETTAVPACKAWLLRPVAAQKALAFDLGVVANVGAMRRAVCGSQVAALIDVLGSRGYRNALQRTPLAVENLSSTALAEAIAGGRLADYVGAVGVSLLMLDLDADDPYVRLRMRFSFPPVWWDGQLSGLEVDRTALGASIGFDRHV